MREGRWRKRFSPLALAGEGWGEGLFSSASIFVAIVRKRVKIVHQTLFQIEMTCQPRLSSSARPRLVSLDRRAMLAASSWTIIGARYKQSPRYMDQSGLARRKLAASGADDRALRPESRSTLSAAWQLARLVELRLPHPDPLPQAGEGDGQRMTFRPSPAFRHARRAMT